MPNSIFTSPIFSALPNDENVSSEAAKQAMEICEAAFSLGMIMATAREPYESPFEAGYLTDLWREGFTQYVHKQGWWAGVCSESISDCPYREPDLVAHWRHGFESSMIVVRRSAKQKQRVRHKVAWHKYGF